MEAMNKKPGQWLTATRARTSYLSPQPTTWTTTPNPKANIMKHRIQTTLASLALIFTAAASPRLCAQTSATPPLAAQEANTHAVPKITVESGRQAILHINGNQYTVTPTILKDGRVELQTSMTGLPADTGLVSLEAVSTTDIKVLMTRIERTIILRAFEKVSGEICQAQLEFNDQPLPDEEATSHLKRVKQQNSRLLHLNDLRERLRRQILDEARETAGAK